MSKSSSSMHSMISAANRDLVILLVIALLFAQPDVSAQQSGTINNIRRPTRYPRADPGSNGPGNRIKSQDAKMYTENNRVMHVLTATLLVLDHLSTISSRAAVPCGRPPSKLDHSPKSWLPRGSSEQLSHSLVSEVLREVGTNTMVH